MRIRSISNLRRGVVMQKSLTACHAPRFVTAEKPSKIISGKIIQSMGLTLSSLNSKFAASVAIVKRASGVGSAPSSLTLRRKELRLGLNASIILMTTSWDDMACQSRISRTGSRWTATSQGKYRMLKTRQSVMQTADLPLRAATHRRVVPLEDAARPGPRAPLQQESLQLMQLLSTNPWRSRRGSILEAALKVVWLELRNPGLIILARFLFYVYETVPISRTHPWTSAANSFLVSMWCST